MLMFGIYGLNGGRYGLNISRKIRNQTAKMKELNFHCVFSEMLILPFSPLPLHIPSELQEVLVTGCPGFGRLVS